MLCDDALTSQGGRNGVADGIGLDDLLHHRQMMRFFHAGNDLLCMERDQLIEFEHLTGDTLLRQQVSRLQQLTDQIAVARQSKLRSLPDDAVPAHRRYPA